MEPFLTLRKAEIRAGYSVKNARNIASENLAKPNIPQHSKIYYSLEFFSPNKKTPEPYPTGVE